MTYRITLEIPELAPLNSADATNRWQRHGARKRWRDWIRTATCTSRPPAPLAHAIVRITRCSGSRHPDFDNLSHAAKFVLDGLQRAEIIQDDGPEHIGQAILAWSPARQRLGQTIVQVIEVDPNTLHALRGLIDGFWDTVWSTRDDCE